MCCVDRCNWRVFRSLIGVGEDSSLGPLFGRSGSIHPGKGDDSGCVDFGMLSQGVFIVSSELKKASVL